MVRFVCMSLRSTCVRINKQKEVYIFDYLFMYICKSMHAWMSKLCLWCGRKTTEADAARRREASCSQQNALSAAVLVWLLQCHTVNKVDCCLCCAVPATTTPHKLTNHLHIQSQFHISFLFIYKSTVQDEKCKKESKKIIYRMYMVQ